MAKRGPKQGSRSRWGDAQLAAVWAGVESLRQFHKMSLERAITQHAKSPSYWARYTDGKLIKFSVRGNPPRRSKVAARVDELRREHADAEKPARRGRAMIKKARNDAQKRRAIDPWFADLCDLYLSRRTYVLERCREGISSATANDEWFATLESPKRKL